MDLLSHNIIVVPEIVGNWAFFLDVDGTLLEIADHPDAVVMTAGIFECLEQLFVATNGAVALVSGRNLSNLDTLFAPLRFPVAGQHGAERRDAAGGMHYHHHKKQEAMFAEKKSLLAQFVREHHGMIFEDKGLAVAIHYRGAPDTQSEAERFITAIVEELGTGFDLQKGKMVFEIKPGGKDKGTAIAEFMLEEPFHTRVPIFIGDDTTDEDGFLVVNRLGGHSVKVGPGETTAKWRLRNADDVLEWITRYTNYIQSEERR